MDLPSCVAITGLGTFLGSAVAERLTARPGGPRVLGFDRRVPARLRGRVTLHPIDLTAPDARERIAEAFRSEGVDAVVHLAFRDFPRADLDADYQFETLGSQRLILACGDAGVGRLVMASKTMLYGAQPENPNYLVEDEPLRGHRHAHNVQNRVAVEKMLASWHAEHPELELTCLRHCWVLGPTVDDIVVRHFERSTVPTPLGFDPLLQFIHQSDLVDVFEKATLESHPGYFNVVAPGVVPLSVLLARAQKRPLPLPASLLETVGQTPSQKSSGDRPEGFYDYLRYLFVADGQRGWAAFGEPRYSTEEAWISFINSRNEDAGPGWFAEFGEMARGFADG